jgi:hypothetical protein
MPRGGGPVRPDGTNMVKGRFFRRLTLRSAADLSQRDKFHHKLFVNDIVPT